MNLQQQQPKSHNDDEDSNKLVEQQQQLDPNMNNKNDNNERRQSLSDAGISSSLDIIDDNNDNDNDENNNNESSFQKYTFTEREEVLECIQVIITTATNNNDTTTNTTMTTMTTSSIEKQTQEIKKDNNNSNNNNNTSNEDYYDTILLNNDYEKRNVSLHRLRCIFDQYLEYSTLLDNSIEYIVQLISIYIKNQLQTLSEMAVVTNSKNSSPIVQQQQQQKRHILYRIQYGLSTLYTLGKVRGHKYIQNFLPHAVEDIEPVWIGLQLFLMIQNTTTNNTTTDHLIHSLIPPIWESIYVMWNWMSTLSLVPFDIDKVITSSSSIISSSSFSTEVTTSIFDSTSSNSRDDNDNSKLDHDDNFMNHLMKICWYYIQDSGPIREATSKCLASWLSLHDDHIYMKLFIQWSKLVIQQSTTKTNTQQQQKDIFRILGIIQTCNIILKISTYDRIYLVQTFQPLWEPLLQYHMISGNNNSMILHKLLVKWWTRYSIMYLPPRIALWRYQRGKRTLFNNDATNNNSTKQHVQDTSTMDDDNNNTNENSGNENELFDVPDIVEDAMGRVIEALGHPSTIIRWTAAKGIGRITERLPCICSDDVVDAIIQYFDNDNGSIIENDDKCWHGSCLALAELARRGLLLPKHLSDIVPYIIKAIHYDVKKGQCSVGSNVRDAACYTYWAFVRAYHPNMIRPYLNELNESIILISIFDREVNCRRAASAAFQEAVGRQGGHNIQHGIDIITIADYYALGNRSNSYLVIAPTIAKYDKYTKSILRHVYTNRLYHWDENIRYLASKSLYQLTSISIPFITTTVISTLLDKCVDEHSIAIRHGSILGVAEILSAITELNQIDNTITDSIRTKIIYMIVQIDKKRLYRGRGGELIRYSICRLIECICYSKIILNVKEQILLLDNLDTNISNPNEKIYKQACIALYVLMDTYFPVNNTTGPSIRLQARVVDKFIDQVLKGNNPAITRGYALAIGYLPTKLLAPNDTVLQSVVACLSKTARYDTRICGEGDAETRRNSLISLIRIISTIGLTSSSSSTTTTMTTTLYPHVTFMDTQLIPTLFDIFLFALEDYKSDRRGDVGSWCRIEGMKGLTLLLQSIGKEEELQYSNIPSMFKSSTTNGISYATLTVGSILKQLTEKLDTVRVQAGKSLVQILLNQPSIPNISCQLELTNCCISNDAADFEEDVTSIIPWNDPKYTFHRIINVASLNEPIYFQNIILGLVASIGGLSESVCIEARTALIQWSKKGNTERRSMLGNYILELMETYRGTNRLIIPILKTFNYLLTYQILDELIQSNENVFASNCINHLYYEEKVSHKKDIKRLLMIVDVTTSLLLSGIVQPIVRNKVLAFLCTMLIHPFPRVRIYTAEQMYICLQEYDHHDDNEVNLPIVFDTLLMASWAAETSMSREDEVRSIVNALNVTKYLSDDFVLIE